MSESVTISKLKPPFKGMDFEALRQEGIEHIERLGSHLWTDYNLHDPGITILEALCYALTDLGYRTSFPIEDILAAANNETGDVKQYYTATEILQTVPVTPLDYRKLLIDIKGIKNAWFYKADEGEVDICCDLIKGILKCCDQEKKEKKIELCVEDNKIPVLTLCDDITTGICVSDGMLEICQLGSDGMLELCYGADEIWKLCTETIEEVFLCLNEASNEISICPEEDANLTYIIDQDTGKLEIQFNNEDIEICCDDDNGILLRCTQEPADILIEPNGDQEDFLHPAGLQGKRFCFDTNGRLIICDPGDPNVILVDTDTSSGIRSLVVIEQVLVGDEMQDERVPIFLCKNQESKAIERCYHNSSNRVYYDINSGNSMLFYNDAGLSNEIEIIFKDETNDEGVTTSVVKCFTEIEKEFGKDPNFEVPTLSICDDPQFENYTICLHGNILKKCNPDIDPNAQPLTFCLEAGDNFWTLCTNDGPIEICYNPTTLFLEQCTATSDEAYKLCHVIEDGKLKLFEDKDRCKEFLICCVEDEQGSEFNGALKLCEEEPLSLQGLYRICLELENDIDPADKITVDNIIDCVYETLHCNRNLAEDFLSVEIVAQKEIGICTDIVLEDAADAEEVQAELMYAIQNFLTPCIPFYSMEEMFAKGKSCEEIFKSVPLCNGFICDEDLKTTPLRTLIYKSDLFQVMMDIPGVKSIRTLRFYFCGEETGRDDEWCLHLGEKCKALLSADCSNFYFYKSNLPVKIDQQEVDEKLDLLYHINKAVFKGYKTELEAPKGVYRNLDKYYSIQNDFPQVYHIGEEGIPARASAKERANIKQLKAYLTFFDQILANYLAQLGQLKNLLSVTQDPAAPTSFFKLLDKSIITGFDDLVSDMNEYETKLTEIVESDTDRIKKKNALLNHLIARFGEQFNDYAIQLFRDKTSNVKMSKQALKELPLYCKSEFLKAIPVISRERGKAFNYLGKPDYWNSENVAGIKKRISSMLCLSDYKRKTLTCKPDYKVIKDKDIPNNCYQYVLVPADDESQVLLKGVNVYPLLVTEEEDKKEILNELMNLDQLETKAEGGFYRLLLKNANGKIIAQSEQLDEDEIALRKAKLKQLAYPIECQSLGFHVLEHILLRPKSGDDKFLLPFEYLKGCITKDPYSFWITVIVPSWLEIFEEDNVKHQFEQIFLLETPAHIAVRFCYLNPGEMYQFEDAYLNWLHDLAKPDVDPKDLWESKDALIQVVNTLDCCKEITTGNEITKCKITHHK